jgi:hypothetical protein
MKNASDWTQVIRGGPILTLQSLKWPIKLTKLWEKHAINGIAETYTRNGKVRDCAKKSGISLVIPDLPVFPSVIPDLPVIPDFRSGISLFSL